VDAKKIISLFFVVFTVRLILIVYFSDVFQMISRSSQVEKNTATSVKSKKKKKAPV
jgi:hypothetical protein